VQPTLVDQYLVERNTRATTTLLVGNVVPGAKNAGAELRLCHVDTTQK
jgi:hypothetical protein